MKRAGTDFLVSTTLYAVKGVAPRKRVVFGIESPVSDAGNASCRVHMRGLQRPHRVHGIDAFQALALSFGYLRHTLEALDAEGWRFYFGPDDPRPFDLGLAWFADLRRVSCPADGEVGGDADGKE